MTGGERIAYILAGVGLLAAGLALVLLRARLDARSLRRTSRFNRWWLTTDSAQEGNRASRLSGYATAGAVAGVLGLVMIVLGAAYPAHR